MKLLSIIMIVLISLVFTSCTQDSALSDVEIDDPSIIKPFITIEKRIYTNSVYYETSTWLYDKNMNSIELKSGSVAINNVNMKVKKGLNGEPYYSADQQSIPFTINSEYTNQITLSDGRVYTSKVRTRSRDLYKLNLPDNHSKSADINMTWSDADNDTRLVLAMALYLKTDSSSSIETQEFIIPAPSTGNYIISSAYFNKPNATKADFTLTSTITGEIDKSFKGGSKIVSGMSVSRTVKFN